MIKKQCLFCDEIVPTKPDGDYDRYIGCSCSQGGFYRLQRDSYTAIHSLPYQKKRDMFHLVSAYIRELTDADETVTLSDSDLEPIVNSSRIPVSIEDKGNRLLQYLYRHSEGPMDPVVIRPLSSNYNLTYSHNLQELVYIIDKLISEKLILREGMTFKLTEEGWREASAAAGGRVLKPCFVLMPNKEDVRTEWQDRLFPKIEQSGYLPRIQTHLDQPNRDKSTLEQIADSKLVIADLTGQASEVYFAAGYALGLDIPVIWTVNRNDADRRICPVQDIRPIVWDTIDELGIMLQQKLSS
ncbi:hypothetical protein DCC85_10755 [Paenibacillus sp. CAA11]|nr:hypothetical protein DCC85_10755 [Paenibacillus sp. CAA11]